MCAIQLQDTNLLGKLTSGGMVTLKVKYHTKCLANLYNRARAATDSTSTDTGGEAHHLNGHTVLLTGLQTFDHSLRLGVYLFISIHEHHVAFMDTDIGAR